MLTIVACALAGLVLGPAATLLIGRPPLMTEARESLRLPFRCGSCRSPIRGFDAVPLVSFVLLRGRCRSCHEPIPRWVPLSEVSLVAAFALVGWRIGAQADLPAHLVLAATLVVVVFTDAAIHMIPTRVVYPAALLALVCLAGATLFDGDVGRLVRALVGGIVASAFLWIAHFVYPAGLGQGDARLAVLLGLVLAWHGWVDLYAGMFAGFLLGGVGSILLIVQRKGNWKSKIAYGPYLAAGAFFATLAPALVSRLAG